MPESKTCRPILFSAPMVRAILEGRKTQTRRVIKPQPQPDSGGWFWPQTGEYFISDEHMADHLFHEVYGGSGTPYGSLYEGYGDQLWVRETWAPNLGTAGGYVYRADHGGAGAVHRSDLRKGEWTHATERWKPSIHMPRAASRITLEITGVRVERLQDISEDDAKAEGFRESWTETWWQGYRDLDGVLHHQQQIGEQPPDWMIEPKKMDVSHLRESAARHFSRLWDHINGNGSWQSNPWVWVIEFRRTA